MPIRYGNRSPWYSEEPRSPDKDWLNRLSSPDNAGDSFLSALGIGLKSALGIGGRSSNRGFSGTLTRGGNRFDISSGPIGAGLGISRTTGLEDIIAKLEALQDPSRYSTDPALLDQQARAAASAQYDPVIAQLRAQMRSAESRAGRNKEQLGRMFTGLSEDLIRDIAPIQQQFSETKQKTADQYQNLQNQINEQYSRSQAEQEAMMRRLNIEAAAPEALEGQQRDKDFFVSQAMKEGQTAQTAFSQEESGAVDYTRRGSQLAKTEGTNRQADLMAQLSDLLDQYEGQIGANEAAKNAAYQSALGQLSNESQKSGLERAQRDFENYLKVLQIGETLRKGQQGQSPADVRSPADVGSRALGMGLEPNSAQTIQDIFMSTIYSDPSIQSGLDPKFGVSLPAEALASRVVEAGRQRGLSQGELNALMTIALEYFGRR